jgi:hypothetical protein
MAVDWEPATLFSTTKIMQYAYRAPSRASSVLLSPYSMRLIGLVIAPLHPRNQLQPPFNRIGPQG